MNLRVFFLAGAGIAAVAASATDPWRDFRERVDRYLSVRKVAVAPIGSLPAKAEPETIAARKESMAAAIRAARPQARQGDVFAPAVKQAILRVVRGEMKGARGVRAQEAVKQGNPAYEGAAVTLKVNAVYPDNAPLSTVPPALLLKLPELPKELDFRFVGPHLVLHDVEAGLIVDFIPGVMP